MSFNQVFARQEVFYKLCCMLSFFSNFFMVNRQATEGGVLESKNISSQDSCVQNLWKETFNTFINAPVVLNSFFSKNAESVISHLVDLKEASGTALNGHGFLGIGTWYEQELSVLTENSSYLQPQEAEILKAMKGNLEGCLGRQKAVNEIVYKRNERSKLTEAYCRQIVQDVKGLKTGETMLLPGGWSRHMMLYEIEAGARGDLIFRVFNSGAGLDQSLHSRSGELVNCRLEWKISQKNVEKFLEELNKIAVVPEDQEKQNPESFIYETLSGIQSKSIGVKSCDQDQRCLMEPQKSGTCTMGAIQVWQRSHLSKETVSRLHLLVKIRACKQFQLMNPQSIEKDSLIRRIFSTALGDISKEQAKLNSKTSRDTFVQNSLTQLARFQDKDSFSAQFENMTTRQRQEFIQQSPLNALKSIGLIKHPATKDECLMVFLREAPFSKITFKQACETLSDSFICNNDGFFRDLFRKIDASKKEFLNREESRSLDESNKKLLMESLDSSFKEFFVGISELLAKKHENPIRLAKHIPDAQLRQAYIKNVLSKLHPSKIEGAKQYVTSTSEKAEIKILLEIVSSIVELKKTKIFQEIIFSCFSEMINKAKDSKSEGDKQEIKERLLDLVHLVQGDAQLKNTFQGLLKYHLSDYSLSGLKKYAEDKGFADIWNEISNKRVGPNQTQPSIQL